MEPDYFPADGNTLVAPGAREFWHNNGYLAVLNLFAIKDVDEIATLLQRLIERDDIPDWTRHGTSLPDGRPSSIEVNMTTDLDLRLRDTHIFRTCHDYADQLLGERTELAFDHVIRKPATVGSGTNWHQDCAYHPVEPDRDEHRVHFWIPIADVGPEGSGMRYLPGSQRVRMYAHHTDPGDQKGHYLQAQGFDASSAVDVPMKVGGAILHHPVTMHASSGNVSSSERTAWILHFARPRTTIERARLGRMLVTKRLRSLLPTD